MDLTPEQRELTGAVVAKVNEIDWNGDVTPWIDSILSIVERLIAQDPGFRQFATVIRDQAMQWSLAAWSEDVVANLADSGWSQLSDRLSPYAS